MRFQSLTAWLQRAVTFVVFVLLMSGAAPIVGSQPIEARIDSYLTKRIKANGIPGLALAVVRDGRVIFSRAYGVSKVGGDEKITPEHIFHFASVSKPFVATAIAQLVERDELELDDPVVKHLPYFRLADERYQDITIRQILNHTAGLPDVEDYEWGKPQFDDGASERYVRSLSSKHLLWSPGSSWQYSNLSFDLLGDLIANVTEVSFEEYVQMNIFDPLGMVNSSFIYPEIDISLRTTGHVGDPAKASIIYPYNRRHAPSSTLNSSVAEMTRWMIVNLNRGELDGHRILQEESYGVLWTSTTNYDIGLSWFLNDEAGDREVFHGGSDLGFRSHVVLLPDEEIGVVWASNWQLTDTEGEIAYDIIDIVLPPGSE